MCTNVLWYQSCQIEFIYYLYQNIFLLLLPIDIVCIKELTLILKINGHYDYNVHQLLKWYLSFYWKKWFYIWYTCMALAWWLVPCLPFPDLPHIYFLFTVRLTNEWVGVFLARSSVQHLVVSFNELTPILKMIGQCEVRDKNNSFSFEDLDIHCD
jgi:hypothetical protein